jgi:hypothetical protein
MGLFKKDKKRYKRFSGSRKHVHKHVAERNLGRRLRRGEVPITYCHL